MLLTLNYFAFLGLLVEIYASKNVHSMYMRKEVKLVYTSETVPENLTPRSNLLIVLKCAYCSQIGGLYNGF